MIKTENVHDQGILVEVEYCPCVVANNCWGILQEFMQVTFIMVISKSCLNSHLVSGFPRQLRA